MKSCADGAVMCKSVKRVRNVVKAEKRLVSKRWSMKLEGPERRRKNKESSLESFVIASGHALRTGWADGRAVVKEKINILTTNQ